MNKHGARAAIILGTRPEIVKLAGVAGLLGERGYIVHSGQHYDEAMSQSFLQGYRLPEPELRLDVGGRSRTGQFAGIIEALDDAFARERPAVVVVQGDTNTAAAAALAADFHDVPVVHVEAGLRSHDRAMPEEINRKLVGTVATVHCAPTEMSAANLRAEGVPAEQIVITGNTVVEAVRTMLPNSQDRAAVLRTHGLDDDEYVLATIHRPENTDDPHRLGQILESLGSLSCPVVFPVHPRTQAAISAARLGGLLSPLLVTGPVTHPTFLALAQHARLLVSDSGGVQEECTVLGRPLIVVRNSTERPEAIDTGFARRVVPGVDLGRTLQAAASDIAWRERISALPSPYGDGTASSQIVDVVTSLMATHLKDAA